MTVMRSGNGAKKESNMKLTKENQLGLRIAENEAFRTKLLEIHKAKHLDKIEDDTIRAFGIKRISELLDDTGNVNYYFSKKAFAIAEKIKIDKSLQADFFTSMPDGKKGTFLLEDEFYRYHVYGNDIKIIFGVEHDAHFTYSISSIFTGEFNQFNNPNNPENPLDDHPYAMFLRLLIFLEFSPIETIIVEPNRKVGTKKEGRVLNATKRDFVLVDSSWNINKMSVGEFSVSGHFRLQRVGKGRSEIKLVYISEFVKSKIVRKAKNSL